MQLKFFTLWSSCAEWSILCVFPCTVHWQTLVGTMIWIYLLICIFGFVCLSVSKRALSLPLTVAIILGEFCSRKDSSCPQAADLLQDVHKVVWNKSKAYHRNFLVLRVYCLIICDRHVQTWDMMTSGETYWFMYPTICSTSGSRKI